MENPLQAWEDVRKFIAKAVNQDGNILDIGCANGFLLVCLQEWSEYKLTPYGIDTDAILIHEAKKLFPEYENNFIALPLEEIFELEKYGLPKKYNLIYWNVWDNWQFSRQEEIEDLKLLFDSLDGKGRLILGFYDAQKENNLKRIENLKANGFTPNSILENPVPGKPEIICWFDKIS